MTTEIEEKEAVESKRGRKPAPRLQVDSVGGDERAAKLAALQEETPQFEYVYQSSTLTAAQLEAKGLEIVPGVTHRGDIVCRTLKSSWDAYHKAKEESAFEDIRAVNKDKTGRHLRSPRKPTKNE